MKYTIGTRMRMWMLNRIRNRIEYHIKQAEKYKNIYVKEGKLLNDRQYKEYVESNEIGDL